MNDVQKLTEEQQRIESACFCEVFVHGRLSWQFKKQQNHLRFAAPTVPPGNVTACNTSSTSIRVFWDAISPSFVPGFLQGYVIYYAKLKTSQKVFNATVKANITFTEVQGLAKNTIYTIKVAGFTQRHLIGPFHIPLNVSTDSDGKSSRKMLFSVERQALICF